MAQSEQRWVKLNIPLVDEWFRVTKLPSDAIVLALHILRRMLAWNKTTDTISVSQLMAATHMPVAELAVDLGPLAKVTGEWGDWDNGDDTEPVAEPGVAMPAGKLALLVGATPHELYLSLAGTEPEVRSYIGAGVSLWERRVA